MTGAAPTPILTVHGRREVVGNGETNVMDRLDRRGAFVVQFTLGTSFDEGRVRGQIEHVASGRIAGFDSLPELVEQIALGLRQAATARRNFEEVHHVATN